MNRRTFLKFLAATTTTPALLEALDRALWQPRPQIVHPGRSWARTITIQAGQTANVNQDWVLQMYVNTCTYRSDGKLIRLSPEDVVILQQGGTLVFDTPRHIFTATGVRNGSRQLVPNVKQVEATAGNWRSLCCGEGQQVEPDAPELAFPVVRYNNHMLDWVTT
mgnify:CR=1 FL=1